MERKKWLAEKQELEQLWERTRSKSRCRTRNKEQFLDRNRTRRSCRIGARAGAVIGQKQEQEQFWDRCRRSSYGTEAGAGSAAGQEKA